MLTFGIGPAGTGKSYCAGALAAEALESGRIERIILTRPQWSRVKAWAFTWRFGSEILGVYRCLSRYFK